MTPREKAFLMVGMRMIVVRHCRELGKPDEAGDAVIGAICSAEGVDERLFAEVSVEAAHFIGVSFRELMGLVDEVGSGN